MFRQLCQLLHLPLFLLAVIPEAHLQVLPAVLLQQAVGCVVCVSVPVNAVLAMARAGIMTLEWDLGQREIALIALMASALLVEEVEKNSASYSSPLLKSAFSVCRR